jgi:hypothetical protein
LNQRYDRRAFLHRAATLGLAGPALATLGCSLEETRRDEEDPDSTAPVITRPVLLPWTDDAVRIAAPLSALPLGYVSRGLMRIFVGPERRLEVRDLLVAHISVSTGLWRIPLPGDDLRIPVLAGDELREFEETHIGDWDATLDPTEGDFRIRRGQRETVGVAFDCMPMASRDGWYSAGPWEIAQCTGQGTDLCREEFGDIGTGFRYSGRPLGACSEPAGEVRYVTWACPDV